MDSIQKLYQDHIIQHEVMLKGLLEDLPNITESSEEKDCINMIENTQDTINLLKLNLEKRLSILN